MNEDELYDLVCVKKQCPECKGKTVQTDKDTFSGRTMREFTCESCGWSHTFDTGQALWEIWPLPPGKMKKNGKGQSKKPPG